MSSFIFLIFAAAGVLITSIQTLLVVRFRRKRFPFHAGLREQARLLSQSRPDASPREPRVSILKPLCGLDDELEANLASFAHLENLSYEVILTVAGEADPAVAVARRVMERHPFAPFRLVVGGGAAANPKVERLIAAAEAARGEIFFISDSNVRVDPGDLADAILPLEDRRAGCVSTLFIGAGAEDAGAVLESLHLLTFVVPGCVLASAANVPCVVGKSMAITRTAYEAIGGFEAFANVLAEDQAIALAVRRAGFEVVLAPAVVRNVICRRSVARAFDRQVRWNKIRFAFSPVLFSTELILNPLVFAVAALLSAPVSGTSAAVAGAFALVAAARVIQAAVLARSARSDLRPAHLLLVPLNDLLQFVGWLVPFVSRRVTWRGKRIRIGRGTRMVEERPSLRRSLKRAA